MNKFLKIICLFLVFGCSGINTNDPKLAFENWLGTDLPIDHIGLIHGQYWESSHWSKEYIAYFEFTASSEWWEEFIILNDLIIADLEFNVPENSPSWFSPSSDILIWTKNDDPNGSYFIKDLQSNSYFIYDIQL